VAAGKFARATLIPDTDGSMAVTLNPSSASIPVIAPFPQATSKFGDQPLITAVIYFVNGFHK